MSRPTTTCRSEALSLYQIEADLAQLCEERDRADSQGESEAVAVMDGLIAGYLTREALKIDSGCSLIRSYLATAELLAAEGKRLLERAKAMENRATCIKHAWCEAMAAQGITSLKSPHNTIRRAGNGGVRPLVVQDAANLPTAFQSVTVKMPVDLWERLLGCARDAGDGTLGGIRAVGIKVGQAEPYTDRIRAALEVGGSVPGCELAERGEHLRLN